MNLTTVEVSSLEDVVACGDGGLGVATGVRREWCDVLGLFGPMCVVIV